MGLTTADFPPVDPATFMQTPYRERTRTLARHWAEYGFGAPKITAVIYIAKLLLFYVLGGVLLFYFPINAKRHDIIRRRLKQREDRQERAGAA